MNTSTDVRHRKLGFERCVVLTTIKAKLIERHAIRGYELDDQRSQNSDELGGRGRSNEKEIQGIQVVGSRHGVVLLTDSAVCNVHDSISSMGTSFHLVSA